MQRNTWLIPIISIMLCGSSFATEQPVTTSTDLNKQIAEIHPVPAETSSTDEALSYAGRLKAISAAIKTKYQDISKAGAGHTGINTALTTKIRAIITAIEVQQKNLVDLVMHDSTTNTTDPEQLNSIINSLEAQRTTVSDLITTETEKDVTTQEESDILKLKPKQDTFRIYQLS